MQLDVNLYNIVAIKILAENHMSFEIEIQPHSEVKRVLSDCFKALKAWNIWWYMGKQDVRNQFRRSKMGAGWVLINLTLMAIGIGYVYGNLFHQELSKFFPMVIVGIIIWTFITSTIVQGCMAFVMSEGYIKQFSYSKQIYLFRFLIAALINFVIGFIVYFGVMVAFQLPIEVGALWAIPGMLLLIVISIGHLVVMAYWGARFRDLGPALNGLFQILFYVTPVIFTASMLQSRGLGFVYQYNPLYYLIEIVRYPLLNATLPATNVYYFAFAYCAFIWALAFATMFKFDSKVSYWL